MNNMTLILNLHQAVCQRLLLPALVLLTLLLFSPLLTQAQTYSGNPILPGYKADPDVLIANGKYYIYPTGKYYQSNPPNGAYDRVRFSAYSSTDLTNWVDEGVIFDLGPESPWANTDGWAPTMVFRNGKYYFYYTAETKIGVAVGNSPTGPFVDKGSPLIGSDPFTNDIIDPDVFVDDDGRAYIYYGGSNHPQMVYRELNPDMVSFKTGPAKITPPNYTEAPLLVKRNGIYYMMYSNDKWFDASYNVRYSTSNSPTGPWTYKGQILLGDAYTGKSNGHQGPGHHGVLKMPGCDEYYIIYHRYNNNDLSTRYTCIDRMYFNSDGSIQPVQMTDRGVLARKLSDACRPEPPVSNLTGTYYLKAKNDGKVLHSSLQTYARDAAGNYAITFPNNNDQVQQWRFESAGDGYYYIINKSDGKALHSAAQPYASNTAGNYTITFPKNGYEGQKWQLVEEKDGYYRIINKLNGHYLHNSFQQYASNELGNYVITFSRKDDWDGQRWQLLSVGNARSGEVVRKSTEEAVVAETINEIKLYPNPASSTLQVVMPNAEAATQLQIQDLQGKTMIRKQLDRSQTLDISGLPAGMYLLRLQQGNEQHTKKLMIE